MILFVGGHAGTIHGEREDIEGFRMFSPVYGPYLATFNPQNVYAYLDSGAFSDPPHKRLSFEDALARQLKWESRARQLWNCEHWQVKGIVSYDLLIDEVWDGNNKFKRRWSLRDAEWAVRETVAAAQYLVGQRERLWPRRLILSCQGVDAIQYTECTDEILRFASPQDIIGMGGWCIVGRNKSWLPELFRTARSIFPRIALSGIRRVHIFGVLYLPALGGLLWLADQYGITLSTDSSAPVLSAVSTSEKGLKKAGCRANTWRANVEWWRHRIATLRESEFYKEPLVSEPTRQLCLWDYKSHTDKFLTSEIHQNRIFDVRNSARRNF